MLLNTYLLWLRLIDSLINNSLFGQYFRSQLTLQKNYFASCFSVFWVVKIFAVLMFGRFSVFRIHAWICIDLSLLDPDPGYIKLVKCKTRIQSCIEVTVIRTLRTDGCIHRLGYFSSTWSSVIFLIKTMFILIFRSLCWMLIFAMLMALSPLEGNLPGEPNQT